MNWKERIVADPKVLLGKPIVKGTRLSVEYIVGRLANGWSEQMLLESHQRLTKEDLKAVFAYVADCLRDGLMFQFSPPVAPGNPRFAMTFLANENFPGPSVRMLREAGFDVLFVAESFPSGDDRDVMRVAIETGRTILTHDRDYGELVFRYGYRPEGGVVYFRMQDYQPHDPAVVLLTLLEAPAFRVEGHFTIVDSIQVVRQRHLPKIENK